MMPISATPQPTDQKRILLDLKPALDGYAGIPQETRLLFRGLRGLQGCEVEGLIQHGGKRLRSAGSPPGKALSVAQRANRSSRVVLSLREAPPPSPGGGSSGTGVSAPSPYKILFKILGGILGYPSILWLRLQALAGRELRPGVFEARLFEDFLWRRLFAKTLRPVDKPLVTSAGFRVLRLPRKRFHQVGLDGRGLSRTPPYLRVATRGFQFFIAQTPFPGRVSEGTRLIVRYHDSVPVLMPHTISDSVFHQAAHFYALQENVRSGAWFCCVSEATRADLLQLFPEVESRSSVIHNMVSDEYFDEPSPASLVLEIIRNRRAKLPGLDGLSPSGPAADGLEYLLMVSTLEPRKNHLLLVAAWERLKYTTWQQLKLVVVGSRGWGDEPILEAFRPWLARGDLYYLDNVSSAELRALYRHAAATICPSLCEGFDYSGVEAMCSGGTVIASDIPVHREVFADGAAYFDPYDADHAALVINRVLAPGDRAERERLRAAGALVSRRYLTPSILPQWETLLRGLGPNECVPSGVRVLGSESDEDHRDLWSPV